LDWAWLSTNETGEWKNYTDGIYGSPMNMNDATDWTWSNFIWNNSSFTGNLSWKIYYNEYYTQSNPSLTYNVTNVTNEMMFKVLQPTCGLSVDNINFSSVNAGSISTEQNITLTNNGNSQTTSLTVKGADWTPADSHMTVGQTSWKLSGGTYTALTTSDVSLGQQVGISSPLPVYFKLTVPAQTPANSYNQQITFTASC
jgi:hypothetical protein